MNKEKERIRKLILQDPQKNYIDESGNQYILKNGEVISLPVNRYNTNQNSKKWRDQLQEGGDYPVLASLNESWAILEEKYQVINREDVASSPLGALDYYFDLGFYPPPEIILSILDCYQYYLAMRGKVTLEDVFFGKLERGVGNHSARKARIKDLQSFDFMNFFEDLSKTNQNKSQYDLAEEYINKFNLDDEPESFLRKYRRYKKAKEQEQKNK